MQAVAPDRVRTEHETLGTFEWITGKSPDGSEPELLFTENTTNYDRLFDFKASSPLAKDGFHYRVIEGKTSAISDEKRGTKAAAWHQLTLKPDEPQTVTLRLTATQGATLEDVADIFEQRKREAQEYDAAITPAHVTGDLRRILQQADAGLLWSKQFYHYIVESWLDGDPNMPDPPGSPPGESQHGLDSSLQPGRALDARQVGVPVVRGVGPGVPHDPVRPAGPEVREKAAQPAAPRVVHAPPTGRSPPYEFAFGDVNPPVHAWACWRVYKLTAPKGSRDRHFLASDVSEAAAQLHVVGQPEGSERAPRVFRRIPRAGQHRRVSTATRSCPPGTRSTQADATAWMGFYCNTMLAMALELAVEDEAYGDMASKFFEHFIAIADAINDLGGRGLWDEQDGFYYDQLLADGVQKPIRVRSLVGLMPLIAVLVLERENMAGLPGFARRTRWFIKHRPDLATHISLVDPDAPGGGACSKG